MRSMKHHQPWLALAKAFALAFVCGLSASSAFAAEQPGGIEEVIVTARQQNETLQDVPVTITAFTEADLDKYNITTLIDASTMVPNLLIFQGGSGNGSNLYLRGVGGSPSAPPSINPSH